MERAWFCLGQDLHSSVPSLKVQTLVSRGHLSVEAQSFQACILGGGRRLLPLHPLLVTRGQAAPVSRKSGPEDIARETRSPK